MVGIAAVLWGCNDDVDDVVDNDDDNKIAQQFVDKFSFSFFCPPLPLSVCLCVLVFVEFSEFPVNQQNVSKDLYLIS